MGMAWLHDKPFSNFVPAVSLLDAEYDELSKDLC